MKTGQPASSSTKEQLRIGVKSDMFLCLDSDLLENNSVPVAEAIIRDGADVLQMLTHGT